MQSPSIGRRRKKNLTHRKKRRRGDLKLSQIYETEMQCNTQSGFCCCWLAFCWSQQESKKRTKIYSSSSSRTEEEKKRSCGLMIIICVDDDFCQCRRRLVVVLLFFPTRQSCSSSAASGPNCYVLFMCTQLLVKWDVKLGEMTPTFTQASQKASKKGEPFTAHTSSTRAPRDHHNRQMKPFELSLPRHSSSQIMNDNNACRSKLLHKIMATHNDFNDQRVDHGERRHTGTKIFQGGLGR